MGKVFLSYSRAESLEFARELHRRFVRDGIDCFYDEASIEWGENFVLALEKGLDECDHIIAVLSPGFVRSEWTTVERTSTTLDDPASLRRRILPLLHHLCEPPRFLKPVQYLDVTTETLFEQQYPKICRQLGGMLQPDAREVDFNSPVLPAVAPLPTRHRMPYPSLRSRFLGRVKPLLDLHKLLLQSDGIAVVEGIGVVVGTGGLGKTQLAIEYVHRFGAHYVGGVFWVNADQPYINVIQELAQYAEVQLDDRLPEQQQAEMLWRGLDQSLGVMLIIYDNFPGDIPFQPWLPVNATKIKTLVTTRRQDLAQPKITLPFMDNDESLLVLNSLERQFSREETLPLIEALGGLPLALELVCNFLNHRCTLSIEQLLQEMSTIGDTIVLDQFSHKYQDELPSKHEKAVSATFQISLQQASPDSQRLLSVMSYWAPVPVPRRLLRRAMKSDADNVLNDPVDEAIEELVRLSLVEIDEDRDPYLHRLLRGFVRVSSDQDEDHASYLHRLLRRFVKALSDQEDTKNTAVSAVTKELKRASDASDTAAINELEKVLPHGQSVLDEALGEVDQLLALASYIGWHQADRGRYALAQTNREWALALVEHHYKAGHPEIAISQSNLAMVLKDLGDYEAARDLLIPSLASKEHHYKAGHPEIAINQVNLALVLRELGDYEVARDLLTQGLASAEHHYEAGHPTIARNQASLALVLQDLGDYEAARDLLTQALASNEHHYEAGHPSIARRQSNLALVLKDLGDYEAARDLLTQALAADEHHYEAGHPSIAIRQSNLAMVLKDLGDYEAARNLLTQALASAEHHYEAGHPTIAIYQSNLDGIPG